MSRSSKIRALSGVSAIALFALMGSASAAPVYTILSAGLWSSGPTTQPGGVTLLSLGTNGTSNTLVTSTGFTVNGISLTFNAASNPASGEYAGTSAGNFSSVFGTNDGKTNYLAAGGINNSVPGSVTATYGSAQTSLTLLWGTVDGEAGPRNAITTTSGGDVITGAEILAACGTTTCGDGFGHTLSGAYDVYVTISGLSSFTSATFTDSAAAAFEFDLAVPLGGGTAGGTPLPAALPLFAGGLGMLGLLARRRKQKKTAA